MAVIVFAPFFYNLCGKITKNYPNRQTIREFFCFRRENDFFPINIFCVENLKSLVALFFLPNFAGQKRKRRGEDHRSLTEKSKQG